MTLVFDLIANNLIMILAFFVLYSVLFTIDKNNFRGANNYLDIFYLTTSTQSSIGYGDVYPSSKISKMLSSLHHIGIIMIMAHFIVRLSYYHN